MVSENNMLNRLQKNWYIESFDFHIRGHWDLDNSSEKIFDLRNLQLKSSNESLTDDIPYLVVRNSSRVIQFDPSSFYEIEQMDDMSLVLTYCVVSKKDVIRMFTIRLKARD